jgi:hypothetical protein
MNLGPQIIKNSYPYLLVQSGNNPIKLGNNADVNWIAGGVVASTGNQTISGVKTFASDVSAISFGSGRAENYIAPNSSYNRFGDNAVDNSFGDSATNQNRFGDSASSNSFGASAGYNSFGISAINQNSFGDGASSNSFGLGTANNIFGSGSFTGQVNLILPTFNGLSSQAGKLGELRISGSGLYVCTGATGGWGRVQLITF